MSFQVYDTRTYPVAGLSSAGILVVIVITRGLGIVMVITRVLNICCCNWGNIMKSFCAKELGPGILKGLSSEPGSFSYPGTGSVGMSWILQVCEALYWEDLHSKAYRFSLYFSILILTPWKSQSQRFNC